MHTHFALLILTIFTMVFRLEAATKLSKADIDGWLQEATSLQVSYIESPSQKHPFADVAHFRYDVPQGMAWFAGNSYLYGLRWSKRALSADEGSSRTSRVTRLLEALLEDKQDAPIHFAPFDGEVKLSLDCNSLTPEGQIRVVAENRGSTHTRLNPIFEKRKNGTIINKIVAYWGYLPLAKDDILAPIELPPAKKVSMAWVTTRQNQQKWNSIQKDNFVSIWDASIITPSHFHPSDVFQVRTKHLEVSET